MSWEFNKDVPIYLQLQLRIKTDIAAGVYQPSDRIPSVRELALDAGVNPNTMQRALSELEKEELIYSIRTSGRFVTDNPETLKNLRKSLAHESIVSLFHNLKKLGMSNEEIIASVKNAAESKEGSF